MPDTAHPQGSGVWTLLQEHVTHALWQQNEADAAGGVISRFWVVNPPEQLMFDTFDEAEAMFERIGDFED
jgi:hypothetical protein